MKPYPLRVDPLQAWSSTPIRLVAKHHRRGRLLFMDEVNIKGGIRSLLTIELAYNELVCECE